jgi:hypothetical protein
MGLYEFIVTISALGISVLGYLLLYRSLKKQIKELEKENEGNEE